MPARSGDCTSVRNRVSEVCSVRGVAPECTASWRSRRSPLAAGRRRSLTGVDLSASECALNEDRFMGVQAGFGVAGRRRRIPALGPPVVVGLVPLDERFHPAPHRSSGGRGTGSGCARRWSRCRRRRTCRPVSMRTDETCAMWIDCSQPADPLRGVVDDARRRDQHLRREQAVAARLSRLARNTSPDANGRPLRQRYAGRRSNGSTTPAADRVLQIRHGASLTHDRRCQATCGCLRVDMDCSGCCLGHSQQPSRVDGGRPGDRLAPSRPGSPEPRTSFLSGKPIRYYRPKGSQDVRHLIDEGFQAFNAGRLSRSVPHLRGQDAGAGARHDHRADRGRRDDAGRPGRLRHRADGSRSGRLHHQHRREPVSRPALRAEFHAPPRLAVPRRRRAVRGRASSAFTTCCSRPRCCSRPTPTSAISSCARA